MRQVDQDARAGCRPGPAPCRHRSGRGRCRASDGKRNGTPWPKAFGRLQTGPSERRPAARRLRARRVRIDRLGALDMEHRGQHAGVCGSGRFGGGAAYSGPRRREARSRRNSIAIMRDGRALGVGQRTGRQLDIVALSRDIASARRGATARSAGTKTAKKPPAKPPRARGAGRDGPSRRHREGVAPALVAACA